MTMFYNNEPVYNMNRLMRYWLCFFWNQKKNNRNHPLIRWSGCNLDPAVHPARPEEFKNFLCIVQGFNLLNICDLQFCDCNQKAEMKQSCCSRDWYFLFNKTTSQVNDWGGNRISARIDYSHNLYRFYFTLLHYLFPLLP